MKKNKITLLAFVLTLVMGTIGCTTTRPRTPMNQNTQNRIGLETPNDNIARRRNLNMMGIDRRNMDDITDMDPNTPNNTIRRNTGVGPNTPNNAVRRNTGVGPNTATDLTGRDRRDTNNMWTRANSIAKRVANLNEVNNCSVLLSGNTAIVGVDIKNNIEGRLTNDLKDKITRTVKDADKSVRNVSVTADPDLFTRISNTANDIGTGKPISGFTREFQEILRRINPIR